MIYRRYKNMLDYMEYLARQEEIENYYFTKEEEDRRKVKAEFKRLLKDIEKQGNYIIDNYRTEEEQARLIEDIEIIKSMLID